MMLLKEFLRDRLDDHKLELPVYVFAAPEYNALFASYFLQGLKKQHSIINFSFTDHSFVEFENTANTTFLGQISVIWLGNCSDYEISVKKKLHAFLKTYTGPHTIIAFLDEKEADEKNSGTFFYEKNFDFVTIQLFFEYTVGKKISAESSGTQGYSCEQIIVFYMYSFLINDPQLLIKAGWSDKLFMRDASLFELSKLFFAKKKEPFFILWNRISDAYAPVFWTVFWSEQLWSAFLVVYLRRKNEFNTAKQVQGRLPFSFLQYDWQQYSLEELQRAHHLVCNLDRNIKLSASSDSIELLYYTFFMKKL